MNKVSTNICLDWTFWKDCKQAALDRGISLNQLVKNGLRLALDEPGADVIEIDSKGRVRNDLRGKLTKRKTK